MTRPSWIPRALPNMVAEPAMLTVQNKPIGACGQRPKLLEENGSPGIARLSGADGHRHSHADTVSEPDSRTERPRPTWLQAKRHALGVSEVVYVGASESGADAPKAQGPDAVPCGGRRSPRSAKRLVVVVLVYFLSGSVVYLLAVFGFVQARKHRQAGRHWHPLRQSLAAPA